MNPDQPTPKSTATGDIHELRYRISQLEHLIVNNNSSSSSLGSSQIHHHQNNSLPSNSTQLHTPHGLIQRVNELEGLLAASESQNNVLLRRLDELNAEKNRQEVLLLEKLFYKDREMKDLREDHTLLELRFQKNEVKLENIKEYINGLPCQEELDEARAIISKLEEDNHLLEGKVGRMEQQILNLQKDLLEKEKALSDARVR
jgi:chromosome segregation ATPase